MMSRSKAWHAIRSSDMVQVPVIITKFAVHLRWILNGTSSGDAAGTDTEVTIQVPGGAVPECALCVPAKQFLYFTSEIITHHWRFSEFSLEQSTECT